MAFSGVLRENAANCQQAWDWDLHCCHIHCSGGIYGLSSCGFDSHYLEAPKQLTYSPGFPLLRVACTVVGKAGVVSVVSTTSGDASPPCVRDPASVPSTDPTWVPPPPPNAGAAVSTGALPLQLPSPPLQLRGSFSRLPTTGQRARPQKRETGFHRRRIRRGRYVASAIADCRPCSYRHPLLRCHSGKSTVVTPPKSIPPPSEI